mgnify:CR=1 FL=1
MMELLGLQLEPVLQPNSQLIMDPVTAFQLTSMMRGVVERGPAFQRALAGQWSRMNIFRYLSGGLVFPGASR